MKNTIEEQILKIISFRAPNGVVKKYVQMELSNIDENKFNSAIEKLVEENKLQCSPNNVLTLVNYDNIVIRKSIMIGDVEVPRIFNGDPSSAETINIVVEKLSDYSASLEDRFKKEVEKKMKSYWSSIIVLFGLFISMFSIIGVASKSFIYKSEWSYFELFTTNLVLISPLVIVLAIFLILLKWLFK